MTMDLSLLMRSLDTLRREYAGRRSEEAKSKGVLPPPLDIRELTIEVGLHVVRGAGVDGVAAEQLLDAQQLVVLRQPVGAAERTGLDLAAVRRHGDVGDGRVFGFAGAMAENGACSR
jgi:hypothetical protein